MPSLVQRSFAGGEIAPALYGRADQAKYATGARTVRNFVVQRFGGVTNRPGTQFLAEVKDSADNVALIPFEFNEDQTYALEFGDYYMRVYRAGARLDVSGVSAWKAAVTMTGATAANPVVITANAHGFSNGDQVVITGVVGMTQLNGNTYGVINVTANTFELEGIDGSAFTAYVSGGSVNLLYTVGDLVSRLGVNYYCAAEHSAHQPANATYWYPLTGAIYEIPTPYAEADVADIKYVQSADVVTLVHPSYPPAELRRYGHTRWTLTDIAFAPSIDPPTGISGSGSPGTKTHSYVVTAVTYEGEESVAGTITGSASNLVYVAIDTHGRYAVVAAAAHGLSTGDEVLIAGTGFSEINDKRFVIIKVSASAFYLGGISGSSTPARLGGTFSRTTTDIPNILDPSVSDPVSLSWTASEGAREYNVYRLKNGIYGYLGTTTKLAFDDDGTVTPNLLETPPIDKVPFAVSDDYPSAVAYFQQRQLFANTNDEPEKIWASQIGAYHNLSGRSPAQDDDAFSFSIAGKKVHPVRHLVDIGKLVILTGGGEWTVQGDTDGVLRPAAINLHQEGYNGAAVNPDPIVISNSALFVQARGSVVRDLRYDFSSDGYPTRDLTLYASHLFDGHSIEDWAYAQIPHSVVWAARDDGTLLGLTYVRDQEVWGWHRHDTGDGDAFERVITIPEGSEDAVYVVVRRTVNGSTKRYVERFASRDFTDIAIDAVFMDSALTTDGRHTGTTTMTLSGGTAWLYTETLTLTASANTFSAGDVGNQIRLTVDGETDLRVTITAYTSPTVVSVRAVRTVPAAFRAVPVATWARAVTTITGLGHLEGRTVAILGDGNVDPVKVVTGGQITLSRPYVIAHVGLPYTCDLETLDVEAVNAPEPLANRKKRVTDVTVYLEESRGMWIGPTTATQTEWKQRATENMGDPTALFTGTHEQRFPTTWNDHGRLLFSQRDPLPLTILAVIPTIQVGG